MWCVDGTDRHTTHYTLHTHTGKRKEPSRRSTYCLLCSLLVLSEGSPGVLTPRRWGVGYYYSLPPRPTAPLRGRALWAMEPSAEPPVWEFDDTP